MNSYRSAISLLVGPEMAKDDRMMRFFRGLNNLRPSEPIYDTTWDPKIVLDHISSLPNNKEISIRDLGKKLTTLLVLLTAHRMQTFSLIEKKNIEEKFDSYKNSQTHQNFGSKKKKKKKQLLLFYHITVTMIRIMPQLL